MVVTLVKEGHHYRRHTVCLWASGPSARDEVAITAVSMYLRLVNITFWLRDLWMIPATKRIPIFEDYCIRSANSVLCPYRSSLDF